MSTALDSDSTWMDPPPPVSIPRRPLRIASPPRPYTPLIGRDTALAMATEMITRGNNRLVTLVGPGGIGKTRLALSIADEVTKAFDHKVAWAPVTSATTPEAVVAALAHTFGLGETGGAPILESLKITLRDTRVLLIVDNFEQAIDAAPVLSDLLHACPKLSLLVTSRILLRIPGERSIDVPPLATLPEDMNSARSSKVAPAVQLFAQHATSVYFSFALTIQNTPIVTEICRRLDGLPLAIELAAVRSRLLSPAELLARMDRRLPNLTAGQRDAPARHRTMRDAIAWSYDLLSPTEQTVFTSLSVFVSGCTLEAAEAICQATEAENPDRSSVASTPDITVEIESLVTQSLVQVEPVTTYGIETRRLVMLETVREYAAELLEASGDDGPGKRHAAYYHDLAARADDGFLISDYDKWSALIVPEQANVRSALEWALQHGDADIAHRLAIAMYLPVWASSAAAEECRRYLERTLDLPGGDPATRAAAMVIAAWGAPASFDSVEAEARGREALATADQAGNDIGSARANAALGVIMLHIGDEPKARVFLEKAVDGYRHLSATIGLGWSLCDLAVLDSRDAVDEGGDPAALALARSRYSEAVTLFRSTAHPRGIARSLHGLAYVTYKQRDIPTALANTQEVLSLCWQQRWPVFSYLEDIADIAGRIGQAETAARLYGAADAERERFALPLEPQYQAEYERDVVVARNALGEAAFAEGWAAGRTLTEEQAVAAALAVTMPPDRDALDTDTIDSAAISLSRRELEVMRLLAAGHSDRAIADSLFIGERTVNTHVAHIFAKLGVRNRAAAVTAAVAADLVDPDSVNTDSA